MLQLEGSNLDCRRCHNFDLEGLLPRSYSFVGPVVDCFRIAHPRFEEPVESKLVAKIKILIDDFIDPCLQWQSSSLSDNYMY